MAVAALCAFPHDGGPISTFWDKGIMTLTVTPCKGSTTNLQQGGGDAQPKTRGGGRGAHRNQPISVGGVGVYRPASALLGKGGSFMDQSPAAEADCNGYMDLEL